jgi:protein TonB
MQSQHLLFIADTDKAARVNRHIVLSPPTAEPLHEVFAESILEDASMHQRRSALDWVASIGVHFAILAILLILPLYYSTGLDYHKLNLAFLVAPAMPPGPPPPPLRSATARPVRTPPVRMLAAGELTAPSFIPKVVSTTPETAIAPPDDSQMGVPGGVPGGQMGGVLGGVLGGFSKGMSLPAAPAATGPKVPVRVGGDVKPPRLLFAPDPEYPTLARQAKLSGVVIIEAVIDEHGKVTGMRVVSGHPMLIQSAMNAVSKRKYEPTILDGEPTPIDLRVEISFRF